MYLRSYFKTLFNLNILLLILSEGAVYGAEEKLLRCKEGGQPNHAIIYEVNKTGEQYSIIKKRDEQVIATHNLFVSGESSTVNGYGGTYLYVNNLGRSGFLMIYFNKKFEGTSEEQSTSLIDINLFPPEARKLNTEGPQTHFQCEIPESLTLICEETRPILTDLTQQLTYRGEVISAFPKNYPLIPKEENASIIRTFKISRHSSCPPYERRIEVFYTGGDWMEYGLTYFVTDAPNKTHGVPDENSGAYFISDLSTTDREMGETPPKIDPLNNQSLKEFIVHSFLDKFGGVNSEFVPIKSNL